MLYYIVGAIKRTDKRTLNAIFSIPNCMMFCAFTRIKKYNKFFYVKEILSVFFNKKEIL